MTKVQPLGAKPARRRMALVFAAVALATAAASHVAAVSAAPKVIMAAAIQRLGGDGQAVNRWTFGGRVTEASRSVVRPSPDLAYAACVYDLRQAPVRVTAEPQLGRDADYMSISVYDVNTDNIFTVDDRAAPEGIDFVLALKGQATPPGLRVMISPTAQGIVLDRRLAPTPERFAVVDRARRTNGCGPAGMDFPVAPPR